MMRTYNIEHSNPENWEKSGWVLKIEARHLGQALELGLQQLPEGHDIYQITRDFDDTELPQPIWDYFNQSFGLYTEEDYEAEGKVRKWTDYLDIVVAIKERRRTKREQARRLNND